MLLLPAQNPSEWTGPTGNNTYLLTGRVPALVDAGVGHRAHVESIAAALDGAPLHVLLITHGHPDHAGGVPAIVARWPRARVVGAGNLPADGSIAAGDTRLRVMPTPGHSPDHLCFFDEGSTDLYCGDLVRIGGTIVIPASKGGSLRQYLDSLRRVRAAAPRRLLPGHGPVIDDPQSAIDGYLRHREEREAQVAAALRLGDTTPAEIAARIYGPVPDAIAVAAADTVLAHLIKLGDDGRAVAAGGRWSAIPARD